MISGYEHFVGGIVGGLISTSVCHPFDLFKVRFSANEGSTKRPQYKGYFHAASAVLRSKGFSGLYQGLSAHLVASPISWGAYFYLYQKVRKQVDFFPKFSFADNLLAGTITGGIVLAVTNPLWVCKTRLILEYENQKQRRYNGLADCLRKIVRNEGFNGLYKGFTPGLIGTLNGSIQFALYNSMKKWRCAYLGLPEESRLPMTDYLLFSSLSKMQSTLLTFPYQVFRTRLQDQHSHYKGLYDCITRTLRGEGIAGLYKGALAATVKQLPNGIITYVVYEYTKHFLEEFTVK